MAIDANAHGIMLPLSKSTGLISILHRLHHKYELFFVYNISYEDIINNVGYVNNYQDSTGKEIILFGKRDIRTITNVLSAGMINVR